MSDSLNKQIVPGIRVSASGEATIDGAASEALFEIALQLEELTTLPVDVEHVVAALVLADHEERLPSTQQLDAKDEKLMTALAENVKVVFATYGGDLGE